MSVPGRTRMGKKPHGTTKWRGGRTRTDAVDGRGRTRTDADGCGRMDGRADERTGGRTDGRTGGRTDGADGADRYLLKIQNRGSDLEFVLNSNCGQPLVLVRS